jgi:hypothetical protein
MVDSAVMEAGLITLAKIIATLVIPIALIPLVFLFSEGEKDEPKGYGTE